MSALNPEMSENSTLLHQVHCKMEELGARIDTSRSATQASQDERSSNVRAMYSSVISLRSIAEQIKSFVASFPQEIRKLLYTIIADDRRIYHAVLQIQEGIKASPTSLHSSNVRFTDVLGEYRELPYEYFCHWEVSTYLKIFFQTFSVADEPDSLSRDSCAPNFVTGLVEISESSESGVHAGGKDVWPTPRELSSPTLS